MTDVRITAQDGRITYVAAGATQSSTDELLDGVTFPGFANTHSHAFHRALRGRTHDQGGTFWTWRTRMYALAARLDPDTYFALARACYAEMALSGVSCVGEFHYLHHGPGGARYADPNAMGHALIAAAAEAGIRITLLDAAYLTVSDPVHQRFSDGDATAWANRVSALQPDAHAKIGAAIHSVRAVPSYQLHAIADRAGPLHVHLSEQPAENEQCLAAYGCTPTELLDREGCLTGRTTAVHATHLTADDIARLGRTRTTIAMCPTTERDLADGVGPARELSGVGCPITLGSDQHAMIDLFEEARALEMDERLVTGQRGRFTPAELIVALTGHHSLGWDDAGRIAVGARADLTVVRTDTVRTAGADPGQLVLAASAADVQRVIVDGRPIVVDGQHVLGDVGRLLHDALML